MISGASSVKLLMAAQFHAAIVAPHFYFRHEFLKTLHPH